MRENPTPILVAVRLTTSVAGVMAASSSVEGPDLPQSPAKIYTESQASPQKSLYSAVVSDQGVPIVHYSPVVDLADGVAVVDLPEDLTADSKPLWSSYVVGHFIGDAPPHIGKVHATVNRLWTSKEKPEKVDAQFIAPKTVLFRIEDQQMKARVLRRHFWHIADIPLVVQEWTPDTESSKPDLTAIPLWVDFKGVPGHLFSHKGLTFFGDTIGRTAKIHPNTVHCTRLDVARILVVLNLEKPLPERISIRGTDHIIHVNYPWLPPRCMTCNQWGHLEKECGKKEADNTKTAHMEKKGKKKKDRSTATEDVRTEVAVDSNKEVEKIVETETPQVEHGTTLHKEDSLSGSKSSEDSLEENEWQDVDKVHRASPRRETQSTVSGSSTRTISPSRYQALDDIEEGELESSSSDEEDADQLSHPPPKELKAPSQIVDKAKTSTRKKTGANPQVQNDKKKNAKPTKTKNASHRRH